MDRISGLPQHLLHQILCILSQKEAVQTSVLAKSWLYLWCTRPKLVLKEYDFKRHDRGKEKFMHVLNKTLQGYRDQNLGIDELQLWTSQELVIPVFQEWIPKVILNMGVEELYLGLCLEKSPSFDFHLGHNVTESTFFDLPGEVFQSESLRKLSLQGWNLDSNCSIVLLKHLQKLVLDDVYVSDKTFEKMMLGCPLIKYVKMKNCAGLTRIKVNEAPPNLNHFEFSNYMARVSSDVESNCSIEIDAPTVESISISYAWFHTNKHLGRLKSLNLESVPLTSSELFHRFSSKFPCLEELVLKFCYHVEKINLSSRSIKRLVIEGLKKDFKAAFDTPNIVEFVYKGHIPQSISFTSTTFTSDRWVSNLHLFSYLEFDCDASSWFLKLRQLLGALSQSEIRLYFIGESSSKTLFEEGDIVIDRDFNYKPVVVEHLQLKFKFQSYSSFSAFIKALFSVCRPRQIYRCWSREGYNSEEYKQVTEFLCKILCVDHRKDEEEGGMISWQRDIEEVGLFETFGEEDDEEEEWRPVQSCWLQYCAALLPKDCFDSHSHKLYFRFDWRMEINP